MAAGQRATTIAFRCSQLIWLSSGIVAITTASALALGSTGSAANSAECSALFVGFSCMCHAKSFER